MTSQGATRFARTSPVEFLIRILFSLVLAASCVSISVAAVPKPEVELPRIIDFYKQSAGIDAPLAMFVDKCFGGTLSSITDSSAITACAAKVIAQANSMAVTCSDENETTYGDFRLIDIPSAFYFTYAFKRHSWSTSQQRCVETSIPNQSRPAPTWGGHELSCPEGFVAATGFKCVRLGKLPGLGCDSGKQCCNKDGSSSNRRDGSSPALGDPIDLRNGNMFRSEVDVELAGGLLGFARHYNSADEHFDDTGKPNVGYQLANWRADFLAITSLGLTVSTNNGLTTATVEAVRPDGLLIRFSTNWTTGQTPYSNAWQPVNTTPFSLTVQTNASNSPVSFRLNDGNGRIEVFTKVNNQWVLTQVFDELLPLTPRLTITRNSSTGRVTGVADAFGNTLTFTYASRGGLQVLTELKVNNAVWATYEYDINSASPTYRYLLRVDYANGTLRSYHYDDVDFTRGLTRIHLGKKTQPGNVVVLEPVEAVRWDYSANGRALGSAEGGAATLSPAIDHSPQGQGGVPVSTVTLPRATVTTGGNVPYEEIWTIDGDWTWIPGERKWQRSLAHIPANPQTQADITVAESFPNGLIHTFETTPVAGERRVTRKTREMNGQTAEYITEYDTAGNITRTTDWAGRVTAYAFDAQNREISRTEGFGTQEARTVTTDWHTTLRKPVRITTPNTETVFTYNGDKLATRTETDLTPWAAGSRTWTYNYTAQGLLQSVDGPLPGNADTTTYMWNSLGRLTSVTNAAGHVTQITAHNVLGHPATVIDVNGITTQLVYDARGWLTSSTRVDPQAGNLVTTYTRDNAGNITGITLPDASFTDYEYNAAGDVMAIEDATGERIEYVRDAERNVTEINTRHSSGALVRRTFQAHDGLQQVTAVTGPGPATHTVMNYDANGNSTRSENGLGLGINNVYDALDRLVSSTDATGAQTQYGYDAEGNLASVTDARSLTTSYEYDGLGCLRRLTSPDTEITVSTCDAAGNVTSKTDARGIITTLSYDVLGRLMSKTYSNAPAEMALFSYDSTANGNKGIGRLTATSNDGADTARQYDARGNLVSETRTINNIAFTTAYSYDTADRLTAMIYPSGRTVTYTRNAAGQITGVSTSASSTGTQTLASNIVWAPFGPLESLTYGNGLTETRNYDVSGFLTDIDVGTHIQRQYYRDAAGRITSVDSNTLTPSDGIKHNIESFQYTDADRLKQATAVNVIPPENPEDEPLYEDIYNPRQYTYDGVGNRVQGKRANATTNYTYASDSNRLLGSTGQQALSITYDAVGNPVTYGDMQFTFNAANRLQTAVVPDANGSKTFTYKYNAQGERVWKDGPNSSTIFHYDANGRLIAETTASGVLQREYIWLDGKPLTMVSQPNAGGAFAHYYVLSDHIDTALMLTDSAQNIAWSYTRDAFGGLITGSNTVKWLIRFPGQYYDGETGLFYNYFRDYDPQTGRYIESDPIGLRGGINTYAYAGGNPISNMDAHGLKAMPEKIGDILKQSWPGRLYQACEKIVESCEALRDDEYKQVDDLWEKNREEIRKGSCANIGHKCVSAKNPHECQDTLWDICKEELAHEKRNWEKRRESIDKRYLCK